VGIRAVGEAPLKMLGEVVNILPKSAAPDY